MKPPRSALEVYLTGAQAAVWLSLLTFGSLSGCATHPVTLSGLFAKPAAPVSAPSASDAATAPEMGVPALVRGAGSERGMSRPLHLDVVVTALHVQIPRASRQQVQPLWNHVREDFLDSATVGRLGMNGVRVGLGLAEWWDAVKATIDATDGVRSIVLDPVRLPPNYPLALELDERPHDQTLFYASDDGILSGETWPQSRNVLRVSYELDLVNPQGVRFAVVPEVRQRLDGLRWVRSDAGVAQIPNANGRAFPAAGFVTDLEPGQFLLVAPGRQADLFGIVGGAFLVSEQDGRPYDSYVFLRADVNYGAHRN